MKKIFILASTFLIGFIVFSFFGLTRSAQAQSVPTIISHQGRLLNSSNQPVTSNVSVVFAIYDAASAGNQVWTETQSITPDSLGFYETFLGGSTALPSTLPNPSYLQITVQGETLSPRLQFGSVPFAQKAGDLDCLNCDVGIGTLNPSEKLDVVGNIKTSGNVISPNTPWFIAKDSRTWVSGSSGWNTVVYDGVSAGNSGGWYNTGNGRFTAPVTGLYWFHSQHFIYSGQSGVTYLHHVLGVNGSQNSGGGQPPSGVYTIFDLSQDADAFYDSSTEVTRLLCLNAGDYVNVNVYLASAGNYMVGQNSYFAGYLAQQLPSC